MKSIVCLLCAAVMLLALSACGGENTAQTPSVDDQIAPSVQQQATVSAEPDPDPEPEEITEPETRPAQQATMIATRNNGGDVVRRGEDTYYFRFGEDSLEETGTLGYFYIDAEKPVDLIHTGRDGQQSVLCSLKISETKLFVCGEKLFYHHADESWHSIGLDGSGDTEVTRDFIISYLPKQEMLLVQDRELNSYATDFAGHTLEPNPYQADMIAEEDGMRYYYSEYTREDETVYSFYRVSVDGIREDLGKATVKPEDGCYSVLGGVCIGSDGIYVAIGNMGGTGMFFDSGAIYRLPFGSDTATKVADGLCYDVIYLAEDENTQSLYYCTEYYSGVSMYDSCAREGIKKLDLTTGETFQVDFPLWTANKPFIDEGVLKVLADHAPEPTIILSEQALTDLGLPALGIHDDGTATYHNWAQLVGDTYYIMLTSVTPDDESSVGWRQGYRRTSAMLCSVNMETGEAQIVYSY